MSEIKDGGPAFPTGTKYVSRPSDGLSMRDYFAAKAMQAMLRVDSDNGRFRDIGERTAEMAYRVADAMLRAREGK
jgi:hypothetical protein